MKQIDQQTPNLVATANVATDSNPSSTIIILATRIPTGVVDMETEEVAFITSIQVEIFLREAETPTRAINPHLGRGGFN